MQRAINATRCCIFGLIWGYFVITVLLLPQLVKQQTYTSNASIPFFNLLVIWAIGGLTFAGGGILLAIPYGIALGIWEARAPRNRRLFLLQSVLTMAVWAALPCAWFVAHDQQFGPVAGFTGEMRWGVAGYVAALIGSYIVGRELPAESAAFYYGRYQVGIWLVILLSPLLAAAISFPI